MAQTPSAWDNYVGDGVEDTYQVTFPYQKQQEVFVTVDGDPVEFTFISEGWVQLTAAPASGAAIRVQRSTEAFEPRHEFANGVPLLPRFIDENNKQFLYVVQEAMNETVAVTADARDMVQEAMNEIAVVTADARDMAEGAMDIAEGAMDIAQAASDKVDAAVIDSAHQLRLDLADSTDPEKGAKLIGYKGSTVAQKLDDLGTAATRNVQANSTDTTARALMAVGAFGLGAANVKLLSGVDLNTLVISGKYCVTNGVNSPPIENKTFIVEVSPSFNPGRVRQTATVTHLTSAIVRTFERNSSGTGRWSAWVEIFHTGNLPVTTFAKTLLDDADAAAARATLDVYSKAEANGIAIGVGQTWQNVTASRASGTTYTNTTGKPIMVSVYSQFFTNAKARLDAYVDGLKIQVSLNQSVYTGVVSVCFIVPSASTYSVTSTYTPIAMWAELR